MVLRDALRFRFRAVPSAAWVMNKDTEDGVFRGKGCRSRAAARADCRGEKAELNVAKATSQRIVMIDCEDMAGSWMDRMARIVPAGDKQMSGPRDGAARSRPFNRRAMSHVSFRQSQVKRANGMSRRWLLRRCDVTRSVTYRVFRTARVLWRCYRCRSSVATHATVLNRPSLSKSTGWHRMNDCQASRSVLEQQQGKPFNAHPIIVVVVTIVGCCCCC